MKPVTQGTEPEFKRVAGAEEIVKMRFEVKLVDIERQFVGIDGILGAGNAILIPVITGGQQAIKFVIENMFPFQREVAIAITISGVVVEIEVVLAEVAGKIEIILFIDLMADIEIEIIEGSPAVLVLRGQIGQQPIRVGRPASQYKGGFVLYDRTFYVETAGQQSDTGRAGNIFFIPFPAIDVQH